MHPAIQGLLTIVIGGGGNSIVLNSHDKSRTLIVDSKMKAGAKKMLAYVDGKEVFLVNTHLHPDHIGGNEIFNDAKWITGKYSEEDWKEEAGKLRMPDVMVASGDSMSLEIGDETVTIRNMGRAHSHQDVVVYLKNRKLLMTGDMIFLEMHPVLFAGMSDTRKWRKALKKLLSDFEIDTIVPGHGPISDKSVVNDIVTYFDDIENLIDHPEKKAQIREKYKELYTLPVMTGLGRTLDFIRKEREGE